MALSLAAAQRSAENLFLRKQLALFQEREKKAKATTAADRFAFSQLSRFFDWRNALPSLAGIERSFADSGV